MEDEIITKSEKSSSIAPALGLLGLGLGAIATALGIFAMFKVGSTSASMNEKIEKAAALSLEVKKNSDRIDSLALQIEELKSEGKNRNGSIIEEVNNELKKVYAAVDDTRANVAQNRKAIEELAKRGGRKAPAEAAPQAQAPAEAQAAAAQPQAPAADQQPAAAGAKVHKIQNGDTFAKLAKKYNVSVEAIVKANPTLNPSRLKIGQEVAIP